MSLSKQSIQHIGESVGIRAEDLHDAVAEEVLRDCEDKLRDVIQVKLNHHDLTS